MKKMMVNCVVCDMRSVSEETLKSYEQIAVNAATVIVTPEKKDLINRYNVAMNAAMVIEVPSGENVRVISQNGAYDLTADRAPAEGENAILFVNGVLNIAEDALEAAQKYHQIRVNGAVTMPKSISGKLHNLSVNGSVSAYPDGAVRLNRNAVIDKTFPLRVKENALYWAFRRLIFTDPALDTEKLRNRNVRFASKTALIAESLAEAVTPMLSEDTDILIVPDGTQFFGFGAHMNKRFLKKFGTKAYINGDLTVEEDALDILPQIEYLYVNGDVKLPEALLDAFEDVDAHYQELIIQKKVGKIIEDKVRATVDKALLEKYEDGILVTDCATVHIAKDVSPELILERLTIADCAQVCCSEEQEAAIGAVAKDVASIGGDTFSGMTETGAGFKVINAAEYVM